MPAKPPRMLESPPVTLPVACVIEPELMVVMEPKFVPTKPPATLDAPTVTLPDAQESTMVAVLPGEEHSAQMMLLPTRPPAMPLSPVSTLPVAKARSILPWFSPARPPALNHMALAAPTLPAAQENDAPMAHTEASPGSVVLVIVPALSPTRPPAKATSPAVLVTAPNAWESVMVEPCALEPTSPPAAENAPVTVTATLA